MSLITNIRIALGGLGANKLRAALTMLGIMIGVSAVVTLMSLGDGVNRFVADQFTGLGTNLIFVMPNEDPGLAEPALTIRDAEYLATPGVLPDALAISPVYARGIEMRYEGELYRTSMQATTADYGPMRGLDLARGRFINEQDSNGRSRVVVLGSEVADNVFEDDVDPLERTVKLNGVNFLVVGLLEEIGGAAFGSRDDLVIVPLSTAQERLFNARSQRTGAPLVDMILIQAVNSQAVTDVVIDAANALRQSHGITFRDEDDFLVLTQQDFLDTFGQITGILTLFLGAIAGISLLVGGIGIMNIMLVSVTERTREIGLRKAVGAKQLDILSQFLTEAILISLAGGLLGVGLGALLASAIHLALPDLDTSLTATSILVAVSFSAGVGIFFGIYPASRAAALHPIDALRFE